MSASAAQKQAFVTKSLYRNILRYAQPLIASPSYQCVLLHHSQTGAPSLDNDPYSHLLSDALGGHSFQFPTTEFLASNRLESTIRRGFRSSKTDLAVAFRTLRELRSKCEAMETLKRTVSATSTQADLPSIDSVQCLSSDDSSPIRPGTFLIAHPLLDGYFARSVILVLDTSTARDAPYGAYGVMINRPCRGSSFVRVHSSSEDEPRQQQQQPYLTLAETIRPLPRQVQAAFGNRPVREGGPVQVAVQFLYAGAAAENETDAATTNTQHDKPLLGGIRLPSSCIDKKASSSAVYYKGDILQAAQTPPEHYNIFVGASCWAIGQLEDELARGCWLPCTAPPTLATSTGDTMMDADDLWAMLLASASTVEFALLARHVTAETTTPCDWAK